MAVRKISGRKREYPAPAVDAHAADPALCLAGHDDHSALHIPGDLLIVELNVHRAVLHLRAAGRKAVNTGDMAPDQHADQQHDDGDQDQPDRRRGDMKIVIQRFRR